jgi:hypothetical protein
MLSVIENKAKRATYSWLMHKFDYDVLSPRTPEFWQLQHQYNEPAPELSSEGSITSQPTSQMLAVPLIEWVFSQLIAILVRYAASLKQHKYREGLEILPP